MVLFDALGYILGSRSWIAKSAVASLSSLIFFPPIGYATIIARNVSREDESGLPEHNIGMEFGMGFAIVAGFLLYQIPTWIVLRIVGQQVNFSLQNVTDLSGLAANMGGQFLVSFLISHFFGFFFWVGFVLWASTGKASSFFNLVKTKDTILQHYPTLLWNYLQISIAFVAWYIVVGLTFITLCLPFILASFYLLIYGYISGRTARELGMRAPRQDTVLDFDDDI